MLVAVMSFVRLRMINSVRAGRPVPKSIITEKIESLRILIKGATLSLNMAVRTKTGRTDAATQSLPKIEACESFSSCLLQKFSTPTFPMRTSELAADSQPAVDRFPDAMLRKVSSVSCKDASYTVSVS